MQFLLIGLLMLLAAVLLIVWPLLTRAEASQRRLDHVSALMVMMLVPLAALGLYSVTSTWDWDAPAQQTTSPNHEDQLPSVLQMVEGLRQRLVQEPGDLNGWRMLGRSYVTLNRFPEATEAYRRAYELSEGRNADVIADYAESIALDNPPSLTEGEAGNLFEQALNLNPNNPKALFYGGMRAYGNRDWGLARERWSRLRAMSPPEAVVRMLDERLAEIDEREGQAPAASTAEAEPAAPSTIRLSLSVAPELAERINGPSPLFIFARQAGGGGPPVAVVRREASELPMTVELSDGDAMLPGTRLSSFDSLQLVARVSFSGTPQAQSGDLFGERQYSADQEADVTLVIDQVVP